MKKILSIGLGLTLIFGVLFFTNSVLAAVIVTDSFGSSNTNDVPGWVDGGGDDTNDTYITNTTSRSGSSTAQHARLRDGGFITKTISTSGYSNILLKYYWHGDNDADGSSDNLKVYWKKTSDSTYLLLSTHQLDGNDVWSSQVSVSLPVAANNTSIDVKFLGDSNANDEEARIDDVSVEGTVLDIIKPVIASHPNETAEATSASGAVVTYTAPNATDNVDATAPANCTPASGTTFALGTTTVTCNKTDAAGNLATPTTFSVIVSDTTAPIVSAHSDIGPVEATSASGAVVTYTSSNSTDAVDGTLPSTCTPISGSSFALGTTTVTCNKTDAAGNTAIPTTFNAIVSDTTAPVITLNGSNPQTVLVGSAYSELGATVADNYDTGLSVVVDSSAVNTASVGGYSVTYNVTDSHSNIATTKTRTVNVVDQEAPVITVVGADPQIIEVHNTYSELGATVADNYDTGLSAVIDSSAVNTDDTGTYVVKYDATDSSDNDATQVTRTVKVVDTTKPVITLTGDSVVNIKKGDTYTDAGATATDNFDLSVTVVPTNPVNTAIPSTYTVSYNAADANGNNADQITRTVIVRPLGLDATLSALVPSAGTLSPVFDPETLTYTVVLPFGTTTIPTVSATTTDEFATKEVTQPLSVTGTATVAVTSEDTDEETVVHKTYTVVFSVSPNPDFCPNVDGIQIEGPCADQVCLDQNGEWDGEAQRCILPPVDVCPNIEGLQTTVPDGKILVSGQCVNPGRGGGGIIGGGQVLGASTGQVLGASTSCGIYLSDYIKKGGKNNKDAVKKLQEFLNDYLKLTPPIPVNGIFGPQTFKAVIKFQEQESDYVLKPWGGKKGTGYVYKTTTTRINNLKCPDLKLPIPEIN